MRLWGTLELGGLSVEVFLVPAAQLTDAYGSYHEFKILLRDNLSEDLFWQSLTHEATHAVFEAYGLTEFLKDDNDEEKVAHLLSAGLHQMLKPFLHTCSPKSSGTKSKSKS